MKMFVAVLATALLCACKTYHHEEKDESKFFEEVKAADPANPAQAKTAAKATVLVSGVIAEMPTELATEVFGKANWNGTTFGPKEAPDLDALAKADPAVVIMDRPGITVSNGGTSKVADAKPVSFTKDFTVDEHGELHPVPGSIEEGVWLTVTSKLDMTLELVDLEYSIKRTVLERPFAEKSVMLAKANRNVTVQVPAADTCTATGQQRLQSGQTLAVELKPAAAGAEKRVTVALITVAFWNP